ncbi:MAG: Rid family detoxifying hydrolase [Kangiellaceae bacterium]|nr:Rid family detoxifying hydrolase [Kangiellaceae bacterium]MCW8999812.1 Rid family detoxifying hydrolase [Kangiellaceae bacterium]
MRTSITVLIGIAFILTLAASTKVFANSTTKQVEHLNSKPADPALPFTEIVKVGNTLYMSGQIGIDPKTSKLANQSFEAEANQTMSNIKRTLERYGYSMDNVVKCLIMLTDINDYKAFNKVYSSYFKAPYPARSAMAIKELVFGARVEVECIGYAKE